MNIPITKEQVQAFRMSDAKFLNTATSKTRKQRRESMQKDRKKNRMIIYFQPGSKQQHKTVEFWQTVNGKRIQHFK